MAILHNNTARLLVGLTVKGFTVPKWIPGRNPIDPAYWEAVKGSSVIKAWTSGPDPLLTYDADGAMPDPDKPPTADELADFTVDELRKAIGDRDVPVQWHPVLEQELKKRELAAIEKRLPKTPAPRESVTGIKVEDALPLITAETDVDKLVAWADSDKRKTIKEAIDARIAELEAAAEGDTDGG